MIDYEIITSRRRTLAIEVKSDGKVIVRAPLGTPRILITRFVREKEDWILRKQKELLIRKQQQWERQQQIRELNQEELKDLYDLAKEKLPQRVEYYSRLMGVTVNRITIRCQKTRWGSCSREGNLNFNCLLMLMPEEVQDSVVVHELCHRKEMNHSKAFYREIEKVFPDYYKWNTYLKQYGREILAKVYPDI